MSRQAADGNMCLGILSSLASLPCPPGGVGVENGHLCPYIRDAAGCSAACCSLRQDRRACKKELSLRYRFLVPSFPESFQNLEQGKLLKEQGLPVPLAVVLQARPTYQRQPREPGSYLPNVSSHVFHLRGDKEQQMNSVGQLL